ncbi:MAG TPA: PP0621 family protein [Parasulfuritortus sp.]
MTKLLFFILLGAVAVAWYKSQSRPRRDIDRPRQSEVEDMVRCHVCGINLPRSEAILSQGRIYCCDDHRRQDQG